MVSDDKGVELMAKVIRLMATVAAVSLAVPVWSQDTAKTTPVRVVTKTLVASEAQKECLSLNNRQRLHYKFRADSASGSFIPRQSADHCLVWTNAGKHSVTLRYEYQRGSQ